MNLNPFDFFDRYSLIADVFPSLITSAPLIVLLAAITPWQRLGWVTRVVGSTIAVIVVLYIMADLARQRGNSVQPELFTQIGGLPSAIMMRHSDSTFDASTKKRLHDFLSTKLNMRAPTPVDERRDPARADAFYTSGGNWLREHTRDQTKFKILFYENISYGFHRNILGLKPLALAVDGLVILVCVISLFAQSRGVGKRGLQNALLDIVIRDRLSAVLIMAGTIVHVMYFGLAVTPESAIDAARIYGRQLILSFEML